MADIPNVLTIAGSDSGAGAGIQADLKTFMALGSYGLTAITALTAQNGLGVYGIYAPPPEFVALQLKTVLDGFAIAAAKTGMLFSSATMQAIHPLLQKRSFPLVVDPVAVSQSGHKLLEDDAVDALKELIIPGCDLLTPNLPEASLLSDLPVDNEEELFKAGDKLLDMGAKAVLIKGGHRDSPIMVTDYLFEKGQTPVKLSQSRIDTPNNHGTGCTLSAAICAGLGKALPLLVAVRKAQEFLNLALRKSWAPGKGAGPVNHSANFLP